MLGCCQSPVVAYGGRNATRELTRGGISSRGVRDHAGGISSGSEAAGTDLGAPTSRALKEARHGYAEPYRIVRPDARRDRAPAPRRPPRLRRAGPRLARHTTGSAHVPLEAAQCREGGDARRVEQNADRGTRHARRGSPPTRAAEGCAQGWPAGGPARRDAPGADTEEGAPGRVDCPPTRRGLPALPRAAPQAPGDRGALPPDRHHLGAGRSPRLLDYIAGCPPGRRVGGRPRVLHAGGHGPPGLEAALQVRAGPRRARREPVRRARPGRSRPSGGPWTTTST